MLCEYGCNGDGTYTLSNGKLCCSEKYQKCPSVRLKNSKSKSESHKRGEGYKFTKEDVIKSNQKSINESIEKAFVENSTYSNSFIKPKFMEQVEYKCVDCGISEWNNKSIILELDHINGNNRDNRIENLRLLCPNCHSQTDNFRGRNINKGDAKVTDDELIEALKTSKNIRQALIKVGLTPKGANYIRARKFL